MGQDDVPLLVGQPGQLPGVSSGRPRMVKALPAGMGGLILRVVQIQVVEQSSPGSGPSIQPQYLGGAVGQVGHKQGMV